MAAVQQKLDKVALMQDSTIHVFNHNQLMDTNHTWDCFYMH